MNFLGCLLDLLKVLVYAYILTRLGHDISRFKGHQVLLRVIYKWSVVTTATYTANVGNKEHVFLS